TAVGLGSFQSPVVLLAVFGILVTIFLVIKKVPAAVFVGMIITAAVGIVAHEAFGVSVLDANGLELMPALPTSFISTNFEMSAMGSFMDGMGELFAVPGAAFVAIFSFLFVDFFDTAGTLVAIGNRIGLVNDKGELENAEKALVADAVGTVVGAALGTSTVTSFVESSSGVGVGGRTGLTAVTAGVLFLLSIFISPIVLSTAVSAVTAPALVVVGIMMAQQLKGIDWDDMVFAAAGFITVVFMILSYSISNGIAMGFIAYTVAMVAAGKVKQINPIVWALVIIFILYFGWLI
ncbi:NCS2 family permease, partial [Amedibacillus dolichus]